MKILVSCIVAHVGLAALLPWPWWVPNLTLVGLVLAIRARPHQWVWLSLVAGGASVLWAVEDRRILLLGTLALGWVLQWLVHRWELSERQVVCAVTVVASAVTILGNLWLHHVWSLPIMGWATVQVGMTGLGTALMPRTCWSR